MKPAKRKRNEGEDGGAAFGSPPVHFLVCSTCGTVGAASIVNIHDARAILRIVKRCTTQAEAARQRSRSAATYGIHSTEETRSGTSSPISSPKETEHDAKQTTLF